MGRPKKRKRRERERQKQRQRQIAEERHRKTRTWVKNRQKKNPEINTSGDFWGSAYRRGEIETERDRIREREREKKRFEKRPYNDKYYMNWIYAAM